MELYRENKKKVKLGIVIVIALIILFLLRACEVDKAINDWLELEPKIKEVKNKDEYEKLINDFTSLGVNYDQNLANYLLTIDPFVCDENTASVLQTFSDSYAELALEYERLHYIGEEPYSDQNYFNLKFSYYYTFSTILNDMVASIKNNDTAGVIRGFDKLEILISSMESGESE